MDDSEKVITVDVVNRCRSSGMTWEKTANVIGVNTKALFTWREEFGYTSDDDPQLQLERAAADSADNETREQIDALRDKGYNWTAISDYLGQNKKWLDRWRLKNNYIDTLIRVSGDLLDDVIKDYCVSHPENGINFVNAKLKSLGYRFEYIFQN